MGSHTRWGPPKLHHEQRGDPKKPDSFSRSSVFKDVATGRQVKEEFSRKRKWLATDNGGEMNITPTHGIFVRN